MTHPMAGYPPGMSHHDAIVSVDSYHYWGTEPGYVDYVARFLKPGGHLGIVVPGTTDDDPDFETFRSGAWWGALWERSALVDVVDAGMVTDGWDLWRRYLEACEAWSGVPVAEQYDAPLLFERPGTNLGFARAIARRR